MKRKLITVLSLVMSLVLGCSFFACGGTKVKSIEFGTQPATQYTLDSSKEDSAAVKDLIAFALTINFDTGDPVTVSKTAGADFATSADFDATKLSITGFSVKKAGTFTATVKYDTATVSFEYTVVDPSAELVRDTQFTDYYAISNATQFMLIMLGEQENAMTEKYKLTADIDFAGVNLTEYQAAVYNNVFKGTIDGGKYDKNKTYTGSNYKILNYKAASSTNALQAGLFYDLGTCTFENLDLVSCQVINEAAEGAGLFAHGNYDYNTTDSMTYTFKNINIVGCTVVGSKNSATLIGYGKQKCSVDVENVSVDADTSVTTAANCGGLIGSLSTHKADSQCTATFNKCTVKAKLTGDTTGALVGNASDLNKFKTITVKDCTVGGISYMTMKDSSVYVKNPLFRNYTGTDNITVSGVTNNSQYVVTTSTDYSASNVTKSIQALTVSFPASVGSKMTITKNSEANYYVACIYYSIDGSRNMIVERVEKFDDATKATTDIAYIAHVWDYTAATAASPAVLDNLANGVSIAHNHSKVFAATTTKLTIYWSVTAYNAADVAIATVSNDYSITNINK